MASYLIPSENLSQFNTAVFKHTNLSQLQASSLYLGRIGSPISVAQTTTFKGSLVGNNGINITSGNATFQATTASTINSGLITGSNGINITSGNSIFQAVSATSASINGYPLGYNNGSFYFGAIQAGSNVTQYGYPSTQPQADNVLSMGTYSNCQGIGSVALGCYTNCNNATY